MKNIPEVVLFDWDDTLADNWDSIHRALNASLTAMNQPNWSLQKTKSNVRRSLRESFPEIFGDNWKDAAEIFYTNIYSSHLESLKPLYYAGELLEKLSKAGIVLGIVSNKTGDLLRAECEHLGWNNYFSNIIGANDAKNDKPSADPLFLCLEGMGIKPTEDCWFVGDAQTDMECAINAGVKGILIKETSIIIDNGQFLPHFQFKNLHEMGNFFT
jgi:phosphoglycolate phosphatase